MRPRTSEPRWRDGRHNAKLTLEAGFTTVRNVGADGYSDVALRDAIDRWRCFRGRACW